ncbi:MAG: tRNA (adenosine(37)-N6)-threonylcarbamoyltransferase complex dimerization subunit type 1 TsaB [Planctomycetes bacterium]|nr:tRNA (adenosine(37)-N6)-threonylcarbamoyltransferase complex dimerization subunit type 1 TsaB [Planctomycetota bacterium]
MRPVLALDASTLRASVALCLEEGEPAVWTQAAGERGTAALARAASDLLTARGLSATDLFGVVVGTGPGSYTGLRASIALARGLALGARLPVAGVPSCAAAALAVLRADPSVRHVVVAVDARRAEAYRADYVRDGQGLFEHRAPCLVPAGELDALEQAPPAGLRVLREPDPDARLLAVLGRPVLEAGGDLPDTVRPLYLKRSHAELQLDDRAR